MTFSQAAAKSRSELLAGVVARVDLGQRPQLRVGAEHEVDGGRGPAGLAARAVAALVDARRPSPGVHSVRMSSRLTKKSLLNVPGRSVRTPCAEPPWLAPSARMPADQDGHLGRGQTQHEGALQQAVLQRQRLARANVVAEPVDRRLEHREGLDVGLLL